MPAPGIAPTSSLLQRPEAVTEGCKTLIDRGPDVSAEVCFPFEPEDAVEDTDTAIVIVERVYDAAAGLPELLVKVLLVEPVVRREDAVMLSCVPLPSGQLVVHAIVAVIELVVVQGLRLQDALQQTSVAWPDRRERISSE